MKTSFVQRDRTEQNKTGCIHPRHPRTRPTSPGKAPSITTRETGSRSYRFRDLVLPILSSSSCGRLPQISYQSHVKTTTSDENINPSFGARARPEAHVRPSKGGRDRGGGDRLPHGIFSDPGPPLGSSDIQVEPHIQFLFSWRLS